MNKFPEEMLDAAKNEKNISASELLADIKAHISEYYVCEVEDNGKAVILKFFNGQKFIIKTKECFLKQKKQSYKSKKRYMGKDKDRFIESMNKEEKERLFVKLSKRLSEMSDEERNG